jgi:DNA (cytosine-5)-methyltransferase 1
MARRGNKRIQWPEPSHAPKAETDMLGDRKAWKPAKDIIDWSILGRSIFNRKKPLAPATIERIKAGIKKFCGEAAQPFLVILRNHGDARPIDKPAPTLTAGGQHIGLCQPFISAYHCGEGKRPDRNHDIDRPLPTVDTSNRFALVQPFIIGAGGPGYAAKPSSVNAPIGTVLTENHKALVQPIIVPLNHGEGDKRSYTVDRPMPTITSIDAWGLVQPFIVKYYGEGGAVPVTEPLDTITAKDRFGLVEVDGMVLDIHFRMLQPHELAAAMSFPKDYQFTGNREAKVKQIGNAVPVKLATALCSALLS